MFQTTPAPEPQPVGDVLSEFLAAIVAALPKLLSALVFLAVAYVLIRIVRFVLRSVLRRAYDGDEELIADLIVTVVSVFLWFGVGLAVLNIVGMGEIAASLGTATGFIALGVAFALQEMIADTVAGVYLLQDADFNEGDRVTTASVTGTVVGIDLRKTRVRSDDGDLVVLANQDVERKWVQEAGSTEETAAE